MHGGMRRPVVSETTMHDGTKRRAALALALLPARQQRRMLAECRRAALALALGLLPGLALAYEPEIHQKLTFLAAKQFNRCVDGTDLPGLNALQVRIVAKANARQADLNFFVRIFRWNYYDRSGVGDRDILWVIDTRFHEHFDQLVRRVAAAEDAHDRYRNAGRIIGYIQDVSSPAHAVPVYAARWWRLSTKDRFDRYPVDEERLAEAVAGRCDQALAQSAASPVARAADEAAGATAAAEQEAAMEQEAVAEQETTAEQEAVAGQAAVAEQEAVAEQAAEAEQSAWPDAGAAGYQAVLEAAARETLAAVRAPMIGLPATWEVFWTPDEDPGSFGAYGPAGNNFGRGARFPCGLSERCELLRDDPLYAAFALERHADAVLRTMQALAIVQGQAIAQSQAIAQGQAIQHATQRLAEHAD